MLPSPFDRRVGIRIRTFEACSGFTHVTAHRIAQPPKAAFVTRLQPCRLPDRTARQLQDQSTTLWVESSSTSDPRLRGARSKTPLVSGEYLRYSRFWETAAGDLFRSTLRGRGGSTYAGGYVLQPSRRVFAPPAVR